MSKFVTTSYGNSTEILKFDHKVSHGVLVSDTDVVANSDGKKIVPAGTIVGGSTKPALSNENEPVVSKNTALLGADAEGILLWDVDVTHGPTIGTMVIHGFINESNLPEEPVAEAKAVLKQLTFIK